MTDLFQHAADIQRQHLTRVTGKIGPAILSFFRELGIGAEFHASQLRYYVGDSVAPASADRILRALRREKMIDYEVINRRQSLYRVTGVG